ncbi:DUF2330 domain-containing protein [Nannocystis punicea]|uniref:DUF2330 domain-containing protein n=1 Tax=Nannocystis punicea TaxID=2995304 RepID=A0ABY7HID4_9BACT|nr:DUF2330 domain-containing protein [Nannocystis poenicansa]WAS99090.1 DUF2330 domain-containing protein [Nannocystis poenicansa]
MRRRRAVLSAVLSVSLLLAPAPAAALCGFFVERAGTPLRSRAATVVLLREGDRTVVTIQSAYSGPPEDFALVVPVPQVLRRGDVRTLQRDVLARVDADSAPRLFESWEQDPCAQAKQEARGISVDWGNTTSPAFGTVRTDRQVRTEARFAVGEYDVEILGARDSARLVEWLRGRGYVLPDGAEAALRPYVQAGMKFFVARVAIDRVRRDAGGEVTLSPLRFHYESERFELPVRLGLLNADGPQDLVVHVLAHARYEVANRDNLAVPTGLELTPATTAVFDKVYAALLDHVFAARPRAVLTEYVHAPETWAPLDWVTLRSLGGDVLWDSPRAPAPASHGLEFDVAAEDPFLATDPGVRSKYHGKGPRPRVWGRSEGPYGLTHTRLRLRLDPGDPGEDLVFAAAPAVRGAMPDRPVAGLPEPAGRDDFRASYVVRHPWPGMVACAQPRRGAWGSLPAGTVHLPAVVDASREVALRDHVIGELPDLGAATLPAGGEARGGGESPPANPGCGRCQADGGGGSIGLLALGLLRRRRSSHRGRADEGP